MHIHTQAAFVFLPTTSPPFPHLLAFWLVGEDRDGREDAFLVVSFRHRTDNRVLGYCWRELGGMIPWGRFVFSLPSGALSGVSQR